MTMEAFLKCDAQIIIPGIWFLQYPWGQKRCDHKNPQYAAIFIFENVYLVGYGHGDHFEI